MVAAFFDIDGTLARTNVVWAYAQLERARRSGWSQWFWALGIGACLPYYLWLDWQGRERFVKVFFRRYAGIPLEEARRFYKATFPRRVQPRLLLDAVRQVEVHRQEGHRVVILTGAPQVWAEPLAEFLRVDALLASQLEVKEGRFTGRLAEPPLVGVEKARQARRYAKEHGIHLAQSFAYADSISDAPLLEAVGHPVAVNPDPCLKRLAVKRGWKIVRFR